MLNQLTSVADKNGTRTYAFDEFNNRTVKEEIGKDTIQYTYNNLNQLVETTQGDTVTTYDYDKRGNVAEVEENGDTKQTYVFDSTNKMSKVVTYKDNTSGSGTSETVTTKYAYDGAGNRVNAKVELNGSVTSNTTYVVDGESSYNDIIMAKDSVSGKISIFTFSDEVISVETSGNISYYRTDEKNSVTDILDTAGKVKATIEYDEYGVIANPEVVSSGGNIFAYTGHVYEESTGLYYAKARYYDAGIGRFVSEDSYRGEANDPASLNLYGYVKNNPVKYTDPSGNSGITITTATIIKLLLAFGGVLSVTYGYLKSKAGQKAINAGARIQYAGIIYNAVTFMKMVRVVTGTKVTTVKRVKVTADTKTKLILAKKIKIGDIKDDRKKHILQDKHNWNKLVPNPKEPKNWPIIFSVISKVVEEGQKEPYKTVNKKVLDIGGKIVEVTYKVIDGIIRISDAWVK